MSEKTVVAELAIELGLDLSKFEKDYAGASKEVTQATNKLNRDMRLEKLRMDIDSSSFAGAENSAGALGNKLSHLNTVLAQQQKQVQLTTFAHGESVKKYGAESDASKRLEERLLREQKAQANLEVQIKNVNKARSESSKMKFDGAMAAGSKAYDAVGIAVSALAVLSVKAATESVESESLFETAFGSMADSAREWSVNLRKELGLNDEELRKQAGTLFVMTQAMGLTDAEAYKLSTSMVELAQDMASFYNLSSEDAFRKIQSGLTGEVKPLKDLGISLDENTVKQTAWRMGLAQQGEELTNQQKIMARYYTLLQVTSTAQGDLARTLESPANQMRRLKAESQMLMVELGVALLPVFKDMMGEVQGAYEGFENLTDAQKSMVIQSIETVSQIALLNTSLSGLTQVLGLPLPGWAKLAVAIALAEKGLSDYIDSQEKLESKQNTARPVDKFNAKVRKNDDGTYEKETDEISVPKFIAKTVLPFAPINTHKYVQLSSEEEEQRQKQINEPDPKIAEREKQKAAEAAKEQARIEEQKQAVIAANAKATKALVDQTYKATHDALQAELYDLDQKVLEYKKQQLDEVTITEWAEAQKAKIMRDFTDSTVDQLNAAFESSLETRLKAIEKEKKAWEKKGVDEVAATKWAEEEKRKAVQSVALDAIKNHRKQLEEIRDAMTTTTGSYTKDGVTTQLSFDNTSRLERVRENMISEERKKLGIKDGDTFSPELIKQYERMQDSIQNNLVPGLERNPAAGQMGNAVTTVGNRIITVSPHIEVNIDNPVVRDSTDLAGLADTVADKINIAIVKATEGGIANAY